MILLYNGFSIDAAGDGYYVGGQKFATIGAARAYVDGMIRATRDYYAR